MAPGTPGAIDSPQNARIVAARALRSTRGRRDSGAFLVEGPHAIGTALGASCAVREVFVTDVAADRDVALMRDFARHGVTVHTVTDRALRAIVETVTPQGMVAVVDIPVGPEIPKAPRLAVVLDRCADPGNAGTVIRTADAAGVDAVVLGAGSVDVWSGKCVRASAGSVFHLPLSTAHSTVDAIADLRQRGCQILATAADGDFDLDELVSSSTLSGPTAWVFGSEAHGLAADLLALADGVVRIPIHGRAESLNLGAAAAICLYSSARAQRAVTA
ncbi:MAG TPA: RNA methyltransferase [Mycobacteriales bacterium]|jgi:TrmH family RNA methyltransferase|nr:RNA methyltransferase [Mycobacteriales bacterium]